MSHREYVDKIMSQNSDIEAGILWDLEISPPKQLHSDIMNKIHNEGKLRRRFNYKLFISAAAAVVALAVFINGSKSAFNGFQVAENSPNGDVKVTVQVTPTPSAPEIYSNAPGTEAPEVSITAEPGSENPATKDNSSENSAGTAKAPATVKPDKAETTPSIVADKGQTAGSSKQSSDQNKKDDDASQSIDSDKSVAMGIGDKGITDGTTTQLSDKDANINLEIVLPDSSNEVLEFMKANGVLIEDGEYKVYKLDASKTEELNNVAASNDCEMKVVNGQINGNDMVVRLVVK